VNLAASLAAAEQQTLLIDADPQGNATSGVGLQKENVPLTLYDVLVGNSDLGSSRQASVQFPKLDVVAATPDLAAAEVELVDKSDRDLVMRGAIESLRDGSFFVQPGPHQESEYLYFSFVTLTTLGFGDLSPAVGLPQALVALEALLGQVFLVTLVARLVTLWVRQSADDVMDEPIAPPDGQ
jgi:hypothetical protein